MTFSVAELLEPGTLVVPKLPPRSECKSLCRLTRPDIDNADGPGSPTGRPRAGEPGMDEAGVKSPLSSPPPRLEVPTNRVTRSSTSFFAGDAATW